MTSRKLRLSLVTAAVIAALAATSCGTSSLDEGLNDDTDLTSSTKLTPAADEIAAALKESSEFDFELDDPLIPLDPGTNAVGHDSYLEEEHCFKTEAEVGLGFDGENFVPIVEEVLRINSQENELAFARWGFKELHSDNQFKYIQVHGSGDFSGRGGYYIAVSDFESGGYEVIGPFDQFEQWINIKEPLSYSGIGHGYISVICFDGDSVNLRGLSIVSGNAHADAADA